MPSIQVTPMDRGGFGESGIPVINIEEYLYLINVNRYYKNNSIYRKLMRENNIEYGKQADKKIINCLKTLEGFKSIHEIRDNQRNRGRLQGMERLENDVNMHLGIDYVLVVKDKTYYIDTKGFKYKYEYCGRVENGIVETILLQVEKYYGKVVYNGWANNPNHLTEYILILLNDHIYFMDYKKLVQYCKRFNKDNCDYKVFDKKYGNYEICVKASVKDMIENKVITNIKRVS